MSKRGGLGMSSQQNIIFAVQFIDSLPGGGLMPIDLPIVA